MTEEALIDKYKRAQALVWRELENKATREERAWLNEPENLPLWRAALVEITLGLGSARSSPVVAKCQARIAMINGLRSSQSKKDETIIAATVEAHRNKPLVALTPPGPAPVPVPPRVDTEKALTEIIEMLSGLDDLKAAAVRDRCVQARRRAIELRIALRPKQL